MTVCPIPHEFSDQGREDRQQALRVRKARLEYLLFDQWRQREDGEYYLEPKAKCERPTTMTTSTECLEANGDNRRLN